MASKTYAITQDQFTRLRQELLAQSVILTGATAGSFNPPGHSEITLGYAYVNGSLTLTILHEAWYENADEIWAGLAPYLPS